MNTRLIRLLSFLTPARLMVAVAAITLVVEAFVADRKWGLFTGGFGSSQIVDTMHEWLLLLAGAGLVHGLFFWLIWKILSFIHRKRAKGLLLRFNILTLAGGGFIAILIAKFEILSYFSDAISFSLIKSLGGGSVKEAVMYGIYHGGAIILIGAIATIGYSLCLWLIARSDPKGASTPFKTVHVRELASIMMAVLATLFGIGRIADARYANMHFTAFGAVTNVLDQLSDVDRDGYSWFSAQLDTHPLDPARHPFSLDVPNNGIDEDEIGGDLKLAALPKQLATPAFAGKKPHYIHVVFESARGDLVGKKINGKLVAPNLTALAQTGSYAPAFSPVGFTSESLKAMFTGYEGPPIHSKSLFTDFKANGYKIGLFSGQAEHFGDIAETVSSPQTADVFIDAEKLKEERSYGYSSRASIKLDEMVLLREFDKNFGAASKWVQPTFLYFNFQSAHFPYVHPGMKNLVLNNPIPRNDVKQANQKWVAETYWNSLAYADSALGDLVARLKKLGVWDDTVLVVTGDHGEELFEDGFLGHGHIIKTIQYQTFFVASRPGYGSTTPIALTDYREMVHKMMTNAPPVHRTEPVLMHIGPLQEPGAIGMVDAQNRFTIVHLDTKDVQLGEYAPRKAFNTLSKDELARVEALIRLWGTERWKHHLLHNKHG